MNTGDPTGGPMAESPLARHLTRDTDGRLILQLRDIGHTMRVLYEGKGSQQRVLILLLENAPITQQRLTRLLGIQPGSVSEVLAKLEGAGLVRRSASETDRRTADIRLTEQGIRQAEAFVEQRRQRHAEMFGMLTGPEKAQLLCLLEKINLDWDARYRAARPPQGKAGSAGRKQPGRTESGRV